MTTSRTAERVLNYGPGPPEDGRERRSDVCPTCGGERWEILGPPDVFYCDECKKGTVGPNADVPTPKPEQLGLEVAPAAALFDDGPPPDEGMAWVSEEAADE